MDIKKVNDAYEEIVKLASDNRQLEYDKQYFKNILDNEELSSNDWSRISTNFVQIINQFRKNIHRIKILKGRIHFEAQTI
jgi:hypothetical protein